MLNINPKECLDFLNNIENAKETEDSKKVKAMLESFIANLYGENEAEDASYDLDALSKYLAHFLCR